MFIGDVGIYLGCRNTTVSQHTLHAANIRTVHQQVGGETVPHGVWADVFGDAGETGVFGDHALNTTSREAAIVARGVRL